MIKALVLAVLLSTMLCLSQSQAQLPMLGIGAGTGAGGAGGGGVNPCAASGNQMDGSAAPGCNLIWMAH